MNVDLLLKVRAKIAQDPEHFEMETWAKPTACGMVCCIGGWGVLLSRDLTMSEFNRLACSGRSRGPYSWFEAARQAYGLTENQAERLFYTENWPVRFTTVAGIGGSISGVYTCRSLPNALARIDFFIETGGTDGDEAAGHVVHASAIPLAALLAVGEEVPEDEGVLV